MSSKTELPPVVAPPPDPTTMDLRAIDDSVDQRAISFNTIQNQPALNDQTPGIRRNLWPGNSNFWMIGKNCRSAFNPLHDVIGKTHVAVVGKMSSMSSLAFLE